jgi:hypothetical protein
MRDLIELVVFIKMDAPINLQQSLYRVVGRFPLCEKSRNRTVFLSIDNCSRNLEWSRAKTRADRSARLRMASSVD